MALGAEPPPPHTLEGPPVSGRLLDRNVARPGDALFAASGAAFLTVVLAQSANAFACRSNRLTPWELGWMTNRLLLPAVACGVVFSLTVLVVPWFADALEHSIPDLWGAAVALLSVPIVFAVDALDKRRTRQ